MPPKAQDDKKGALAGNSDERYKWFENQIRTIFKLPDKDFQKLQEADEYRYVLTTSCNFTDCT